MHARIDWVENAAFTGETGSGHTVVVDGPPEIGGKNRGARPMELMLLSVGSCSAVDVVHILKKGRHPVAGVQVEVAGTRAETDPKVFTALNMHFVVTGRGLPLVAVERAVALSHEKYCSATAMLAHTASITTSVEVREAA